MKKGKIIALIAVLMFSITLVWGLFKRLPVDPLLLEESPFVPSEITENSVFYSAESTVFVRVTAPVDVILDSSFAGVKLLGDSSLFKHFYIETDQHKNQRQGINVHTKTGHKGEERDSFAMSQIENSNLKIHIGTVGNKGHTFVEYHFVACKSVKTSSPLNFKNVRLDFDFVQNCNLDISSTQMALWAHGKNGAKQSEVVINGSCERFFINDCASMHLDVKDVETKELYAFDIRDSKVEMYASELANLIRICNSDFEVNGNPTYYKESDIGFPYCKN